MKELEKEHLDSNDMSEKLLELEDRSRRNNLHSDVLKENTNETWDDSEEKVQKEEWDTFNIRGDTKFDRYHGMGKQNVKKLKNTGIYIYEDFCKDIMVLEKYLLKISWITVIRANLLISITEVLSVCYLVSFD